MIHNLHHRPLFGKACSVRFFYPAEHDGPGTLTIVEYRCLLRQGHSGPHQVEVHR